MGLVWQPVSARLRNPTSLFGGWLCSCVHFLWRENITEYTQVTDSKSWVSPPRGGGGEIARGGGFKRGGGGPKGRPRSRRGTRCRQRAGAPGGGGGIARVFQGKLWYPPLMQATRTQMKRLLH